MLIAQHKDATKAMRTTTGAANPAYPTTITSPPTTAPAGATFAAQYQAKFQVAPAMYSAESYDATNALLTAIGSGNSAAVTGASAESAVNAVDYAGITGPMQFLPSGELKRPTTNHYQQQNGQIVWVGNMSTP